MSSFLCTYETLAKAASAGPEHLHGQSFHQLMLLNADGYSQRYAHIAEAVEAANAFCQGSADFLPAYCADPLVAWNALRCVLYQASEGNVPESDAYKTWDEYCDEIAHQIAHRAAHDAGLGWNS